MDFLRVPEFLNAHLTKDLDRQGSCAILGHGHIGGKNSNLSRMVYLPASISFDADDPLSEGKRIIVQDRLRQLRQEAGRKLPLLKMNLVPLQGYRKIVVSTFVPMNSPMPVASSLRSCFSVEVRGLNGWTLTSVWPLFRRCSHTPPATPSMSRTGAFPSSFLKILAR